MLLLAILAPVLTPYDPIQQDLQNTLQPPSGSHWLGTDKLGRDVLARLLFGARVDLRIGFLAVLIPFVIGSILGSDRRLLRRLGRQRHHAGRGRVLRLPALHPRHRAGLRSRLGRAEHLSRHRARLVGLLLQDRAWRGDRGSSSGVRPGGPARRPEPCTRVLGRHIGPNVISQAITYAMSDIVMDIMVIVTLGYLGLGITPPTPEWGGMIADAKEFITTLWWMAVLPGPRGRDHRPRSLAHRRRTLRPLLPGTEEVNECTRHHRTRSSGCCASRDCTSVFLGTTAAPPPSCTTSPSTSHPASATASLVSPGPESP